MGEPIQKRSLVINSFVLLKPENVLIKQFYMNVHFLAGMSLRRRAHGHPGEASIMSEDGMISEIFYVSIYDGWQFL
jgi:hypothetical protein